MRTSLSLPVFFLCNFVILHQQRATFSPHLCLQLPLVVSWVPARTFDLFIELRVRGLSQREVVCFCLLSLWSGLTKPQLDTLGLIFIESWRRQQGQTAVEADLRPWPGGWWWCCRCGTQQRRNVPQLLFHTDAVVVLTRLVCFLCSQTLQLAPNLQRARAARPRRRAWLFLSDAFCTASPSRTHTVLCAPGLRVRREIWRPPKLRPGGKKYETRTWCLCFALYWRPWTGPYDQWLVTCAWSQGVIPL